VWGEGESMRRASRGGPFDFGRSRGSSNAGLKGALAAGRARAGAEAFWGGARAEGRGGEGPPSGLGAAAEVSGGGARAGERSEARRRAVRGADEAVHGAASGHGVLSLGGSLDSRP
jgi:hypothetical protein